MHTFKHPKYYKELRRRNKETQQEPQRILDKPGRSVSNSDQAISLRAHDGECERAPDSGHKHQASSTRHQASSVKLSNQPEQASSDKPLSHKHRA
jgi:hypothetical protein